MKLTVGGYFCIADSYLATGLQVISMNAIEISYFLNNSFAIMITSNDIDVILNAI